MNQETIDKIRQALKQATKWTCVPDPTCVYVPVGKLHWQEVRPPDAMLPSLPAACLLLDHAPELLDEIERLTKENSKLRAAVEAADFTRGAWDVLAFQDRIANLKAERVEQDKALQSATDRLIELNVENAELKAEIEIYQRPQLKTNITSSAPEFYDDICDDV